MILICEEWCYRHHLASDTEKAAARERFDLAVSDGCGLAVREIFHTAQPLKRGIRCGKEVPQGVTTLVHVHEQDDSTWTDLTQQ